MRTFVGILLNCMDNSRTIICEASFRRHLKLEDADGISSLPNTEIFEQLAFMGNMKRASKGYTGMDIPLFPTMLVQGLILQGEGSTVLVESHHTPSGAPTTLQPLLSSRLRTTLRQETEVPQPSSVSQTHDTDEAASIRMDVRLGGAATTISSLGAGQGSGNIDNTPSMPHDSPLPGGYIPGSDEGRMQQNELMDLVTKLSNRVLVLETNLKETKKVYSTAFKKLIMKVKKLENVVKSNKARRRAKFIGWYEDISTAEFNISTAKPVSTAGAAVTTASVSTIEPSAPLTTIIKTYTRTTRGMVESEKPSKKKDQVKADEELAKRLEEEMQAELEEKARIERIAQEEASIAALTAEFDVVQARMDDDALLPAKLQEEEREQFSIDEQARFLKWIKDFVPMDSKVVGSGVEKGVGSRKKTFARKRTGGKDSGESMKKQKLEDDTENEELKAYFGL
ncbi:hypothetical protein Tco_0567242 [Tanacetum coccineum]